MNIRHDQTESDALTPTRLRAVLAVATTGSFSDAARAVGTSQSNVSRAVAAVEAALGRTLFERSTRSVSLTSAGREFVERATLIAAELEAAVRDLRPDAAPTPRLNLAALTSVSELHLADALARARPTIGRFRCIEGLQATVEDAVSSGRAQIGIGDLAAVPSTVEARALWTEPFLVALPVRHRLARRGRLELDDLAGESLIGFSRDAELRTTLDRHLAAARQLRTPEFVVDRYRTALSLVAAGLGVMVVPAIAAPAVPSGAQLLQLEHPDLRRTMGTMRRPGAPVAAALDELAERVTTAVLDIEGAERAR